MECLGFRTSGFERRFIYPDKSTGHNTVGVTEPHIFANASLRAYGVAVYVCSESMNSRVRSTHLLLSKGRIASLKPLSLPRSELVACLTAAQLYDYMRSIPCFKAARPFFWTDSQMSQDPGHRDLYVRNRVAEIQRLTAGNKWTHCRSKENPADILTRGIAAVTLLRSSMWWKGPTWLSLPIHTWETDVTCSIPLTALVLALAQHALSPQCNHKWCSRSQTTACTRAFFELLHGSTVSSTTQGYDEPLRPDH